MSNCFIDTTNLEFPIYEEVLRARLGLNSNDVALPSNFVAVDFEDPPEINDMTHIREPLFPKLVGDRWVVQWELKELTAEQKHELANGPASTTGMALDILDGSVPDVIG